MPRIHLLNILRHRVERLLFYALYSLSVVPILALLSVAQVNPGAPSFSAYDSHTVDTINLQNLNISVNVPVYTKSGAFPFSYRLNSNYYVYKNSVNSWSAAASGASSLVGSPTGFVVSASPTTIISTTCPNGMHTGEYANWYITFADGTVRWLPSSDVSDDAGCINAGFTDQVIDGSGYTLTVNLGTVVSIYDRAGSKLSPGTLTDSNGNSIASTGMTNMYKDTLGVTALSVHSGGSGPYTWTDTNGGSPQVTTSFTAMTLQSAFGCSGITEYNFGSSEITTVAFPDSTSLGLSFEPTPGHAGNYTGRLAMLTVPTGGSISYAYGGSHNGIDCTYQVSPSLTRTTSDGTTTYTWAAVNNGGGNYGNTTTVVDNGGNKTVYTFTGLTSTGNAAPPVLQVITQIQHYRGLTTLLTTDVYCYNANLTGCATAVVQGPVTEVDVLHTINGMSSSTRSQTKYDSYGNIIYSAQYDFGASSPATATTNTYGSWNGTACASIGNHVNNKVCDVQTQANGSLISESRHSYDSHGNLLTDYIWTGSIWLSNATPNGYNTNGTPTTTYDLENHSTTYSYIAGSYAGCTGCTNYPFPTSISKGGITVSSTWSGIGAVKLTDVDANGNVEIYGYTNSAGTADPFWRIMSVTDPLGNVGWNTYPSGSSPNTMNSNLSFNSSSSIQNVTSATDGYGRKVSTQSQQSPSSTTYDTNSVQYLWSGNYREIQSTAPCSTTYGTQCSFATAATSLVDPLGRTYQITDGGGGVVTKTYTQNDVLTVLGPAPINENVKQVQKEYDGLGRLTKSCSIGNGSATACGQNSGTANGVTTSYSYTFAVGSSTVSVSRGSQTRTKVVDAIGRLTQKTTPEGGTWTYYYDLHSACPVGYRGVTGQLAALVDPDGNLLLRV